MTSVLFTVPHYVKADSEDELIKAMLANNISGQTCFKYFDIQKVGKQWFAWYLVDASAIVNMRARKALLDGPV